MDTYIEEIFRRKAEMTDHCILVAQWEYDKRLLPDALKAINQVFRTTVCTTKVILFPYSTI